MKIGKKAENGVVTTEKVLEKKGIGAEVIERQEDTVAIGPFSVEAVHAEVEANVRILLSENYHSVTVGVSVRIPVDPTHEAVQKGMDYCFDTANSFLEKETRGAREVLRQVAASKR